MFRWICVLVVSLCLGGWAVAQVETVPHSDKSPGPSQAPPRSDRDQEAGESSSRDTRIDLSPPKDDAKGHPFSGVDLDDTGSAASGDVQEFHPWNPHKAAKDVEVGDFYFKRRNYHAALDRYREALYWKNNDAVANFRMAQCLEKMNQPLEARAHYEEYVKILPEGPFSEEAKKAIARLKGPDQNSQAQDQPKQ
jgi:tetratricopeptide (TPR) repeat protein